MAAARRRGLGVAHDGRLVLVAPDERLGALPHAGVLDFHVKLLPLLGERTFLFRQLAPTRLQRVRVVAFPWHAAEAIRYFAAGRVEILGGDTAYKANRSSLSYKTYSAIG